MRERDAEQSSWQVAQAAQIAGREHTYQTRGLPDGEQVRIECYPPDECWIPRAGGPLAQALLANDPVRALWALSVDMSSVALRPRRGRFVWPTALASVTSVAGYSSDGAVEHGRSARSHGCPTGNE